MPSKLKSLFDEILRRGNDKLVIKVLWSASISTRFGILSAREKKRCPEHVRNMASESSRFRSWFRTWGYDESRIRLITRVAWRDRIRDSDSDWDWDNDEEEVHGTNKSEIF
jgi:hypothetical protein